MAKKLLIGCLSVLVLGILAWELTVAVGPKDLGAPHKVRPASVATKPISMSWTGDKDKTASRPTDRGSDPMVADLAPGGDSTAKDWRYAHPTTLVIAPYPDLPMTFHQVAVKVDGRYLTWIGRNPAMPGASFVGIATPEGYDAVLLVPGASQFNFHVRNGRVRMDEVVASGQDCEVSPAAGLVAEAPTIPSAQAASLAALAEPLKAATGAAPLNVDVLFLYNTRALAVAAERSSDPIGYIDGYTRAALETANLTLQQSHVDTFVWRYVGLEAIPEYPVKETVSQDLMMIAPDGQFAAQVQAARIKYGADQVLLWTGTGPRQGAAFGGEIRNQPVERGGTVAALRLTAGTLILAHELAHNFGCHHDRGHAGSGDGSLAQPEGDGFWCYGLLWNTPGATTTTGTVMSYADILVPYYSNPDISLGSQVLGFRETDPRAANNARILNDHAAYISSESVETEAPPIILQQPQGVVAIPGQSVTLSVSAVGGGLRYQWALGGVSLAGATEPSYTRVLTQTDIGDYTVVIGNSRGSVTSRVAALSFAAVTHPVPAPPVSTGSGQGGGGGAPSAWFYAALVLLFGLRRWRVR